MANNYMWKDKYINKDGIDVLSSNYGYPVFYFSLLGRNGALGTMGDPYPSGYKKSVEMSAYILSGGVFENLAIHTEKTKEVFGMGMNLTIIENINFTHYITTISNYYDLAVMNIPVTHPVRFIRCKIRALLGQGTTNNIAQSIINCIIAKDQNVEIKGHQNTMLDLQSVTLTKYTGNYKLFINSNIDITQSAITSYKDLYTGFDSCKFKIGNEAAYTALIGSTEIELRNNFVARCTAQGITATNVTDNGETLPVGKWIFANGSTLGEKVLKDSVIDKFQKRRYTNLGWSKNTVEKIDISSKANIPQSFSQANTNPDHFAISDDIISINSKVNIATKNSIATSSNIFWLGGKHNIEEVNVANNFLQEYGVMLESTDSLSETPTTEIEKDVFYVVRSTGAVPSSIKYNDKVYTTSLAERNNIFVGVADIVSYTVESGEPAVYKIKDLSIHQTIQMRIVDEIPSTLITSGSLEPNYWYFVEPDNMDDQTGTVTYNGVNYPCFSSFVADAGTSSFTPVRCHLRRCWHKDYNEDTESTDKTFWANKQKPKWIDIVPGDLRCLKASNSASSQEMQNDENRNYIASGHINFYNTISGITGLRMPAYPVKGAYMQLRLKVSTLNPM